MVHFILLHNIQRILLYLVYLILIVGDIPADWKYAFVYLIPKPTDWYYDIFKTYPITLLNIMRKAFVKLLTNRLSKIMVKHNILKGNNFAGLLEKSTDEPIKTINMIIEDTYELEMASQLFGKCRN